MIMDLSSKKIKFSPRSVVFEIAGNWMFISKRRGRLWRRIHCGKASVDGRSAAMLSGADRYVLNSMILVGSFDNTLRSFISF